MKNMESFYRARAARCLGLAEDAVPAVLPVPEERRGWLLDRCGELRTFDTIYDMESAARDQIPLPAELEALRSLCRRSAGLGERAVWLSCRDGDAALTLLANLHAVEESACSRLRSFLALRPCFHPELRPGLGLLLDRERGELFPAALLLEGYGQAEEGFLWPLAMNLELTTQCPLRCPQCYVHLQAGRHMPREIALRRLDQAGELGVVTANLSGGETMCYPWLFEIIERARANDIEADVALSGFGINDKSLDRLIGAGVTGIYVSLNGPTEAINSRTRDGYGLAVGLLERLRQREFPNTNINWVVHDSNASLLPEMLALAEEYKVRTLMVMAFKPDSHNALPSLPSQAQMETLARQIREYDGPVDISIETCYSSLRALTSQSFYGNMNRGPFRGCGAGRDSFSVALDGRFSPCRHIELYEEWDTVGEYWENSPVLRQIRQVQRAPADPCRSCRFADNCRHCMAVNLKLNGCLRRGDATCPLAKGCQKEA